MKNESGQMTSSIEDIAADFRSHAARTRSMMAGTTPERQARLRFIAQTFDDRGSALAELSRFAVATRPAIAVERE